MGVARAGSMAGDPRQAIISSGWSADNGIETINNEKHVFENIQPDNAPRFVSADAHAGAFPTEKPSAGAWVWHLLAPRYRVSTRRASFSLATLLRRTAFSGERRVAWCVSGRHGRLSAL
jgi:hypothetical protein